MENYICFLQLFGGLFLLILGGNYLVDSATDIARRFHISSLVIGLTVVAFGTSAPEMIVSVMSSVSGHPSIAVGNVLGSNIVNVGFISGLTALILPFFVDRKSIRVDGMVMLVFSILLVIVCFDDVVQRWEGMILFASLIGYVYYSIRSSKKEGVEGSDEEGNKPRKHLLLNVLIFVLSLLALGLGSDQMVEGASEVARRLSISERVISLVIVAIGTSLPELAASVAAILKKEVGITIGNIIGSNIFNVGAVLGISSSIMPIEISKEFSQDLWWVVGFAILLIIGMLNISRNFENAKEKRDITQLWSSEHGEVGRIWGAFAVAVYAYYLYRLF